MSVLQDLANAGDEQAIEELLKKDTQQSVPSDPSFDASDYQKPSVPVNMSPEARELYTSKPGSPQSPSQPSSPNMPPESKVGSVAAPDEPQNYTPEQLGMMFARGGGSMSGPWDVAGLGAAAAKMRALGGDYKKAADNFMSLLEGSQKEEDEAQQDLNKQEKFRLADEAALQEKYRAQQESERVKYEAKRALEYGAAMRAEEDYKSIQQEVANFKIEPLKGWGLGSRVLATLGMAIGAAGASLGKTPNYAQQIVENAINRDMEAQKLQYNQLLQRGQMADNLYAKAMTRYNNTFQAEQATRLGLQNQLDSELRSITGKYAGTEFESKAKVAYEALEQARLVNAQNYKDNAYKNEMQNISAQAQIAAQRIALGNAQAAQAAEMAKHQRLTPDNYQFKDAKAYRAAMEMSPKQWQDHVEKLTSQDQLEKQLDDLVKVRKREGWRLIPYDSEEIKQADVILGSIKQKIKKKAELGSALTKYEIELMGLPDSVGDWGHVEEQLIQAHEGAKADKKTFLRTSPLEPIVKNAESSSLNHRKK